MIPNHDKQHPADSVADAMKKIHSRYAERASRHYTRNADCKAENRQGNYGLCGLSKVVVVFGSVTRQERRTRDKLTTIVSDAQKGSAVKDECCQSPWDQQRFVEVEE